MKLISMIFYILEAKNLYIMCCPLRSSIDPCVCETESNNQISISCVGEDVNDENIDLIMVSINEFLLSSHQTLLQSFRLQKTSLTFLNEEVFGTIPFINIEIYENQILNIANITEHIFFAAIYTLKSFYASNNDLYDSDGSDFISIFKNFVFLEYLSITENGIQRISRKTFNNLEQNNLKSIDLSSNMISSVEEYAFYDLINLIYLNLSNNSLVTLNPFSLTLNHWSSAPLQLMLNSNRLNANQLSEQLFSQTKRPLILFMQNNKMHFFPEEIFRPIIENEKNYFIDVKDNPFLCDCERHKWLFLLTKHLRIKIQNMFCSQQSIWKFEDIVYKNCFDK